MDRLSGGNVNQVFRDGDVVLRNAGAWTTTVHGLLHHVRAKGFLLAPTGRSSTICHNDLAPYNIVARNGRLVGVIDWDLISPGTHLWEVAFMAWQWVPLHHPGLAAQLGWHATQRLGPRLRLLCDGYGLVPQERARLVDTIIERIARSRSGIAELAANGEPAFIRMLDEGHTTDMSSTIEHVEAIRPTLETALRSTLQQAPLRPSTRALDLRHSDL